VNVFFGEQKWWYLFEHPITGEVFPVEQRFLFNQRTGEWELPSDQPSLPNMVEGSDLYDTREEALEAIQRGSEEGEEEGDDGDTD
jgi:hypothetical protein